LEIENSMKEIRILPLLSRALYYRVNLTYDVSHNRSYNIHHMIHIHAMK
jgi:hypothetical protein